MSTTQRDHITEACVKRLLKAAATSPKGLYLWDTKLRGFGLRASPVNLRGQQKASWCIQRWSTKDNRVERFFFAEYPDLSVAEARKEAETRRASKEPLNAEKRQLIAASKDTLGAAVEQYLTEAPKLKSKAKSPRYWHETRQMLERDLVAKLRASQPLASITMQDVRGLIKTKQLADQHAMARSLLGAVRPFFKWCVAEGLIPASPLATYTDPPKAVARRERTLTASELKALWLATEADGVWNRYFRLLLLTAQRREEVAAMDRRELDAEKGLWTIPGSRTKNGKAHIVHLSPLALAEIGRCTAEGDYLFPANRVVASDNPLKKQTISGYSKAKAALDKRMPGVAEWNVHDLRRTAATWMGESGIATSVIERVLNHISGTQGGLIGTYQHQQQLEQRKLAIEAWNTHVAELVGITTQSNVVPLRRTS